MASRHPRGIGEAVLDHDLVLGMRVGELVEPPDQTREGMLIGAEARDHELAHNNGPTNAASGYASSWLSH